MVVFLNDKFIDEKEAFIGINDLSIQRGFAVFDFFRTDNHVPLFIDDYLNRFYNSANQLQLQPPYESGELKHIIFQMIEQNKLPKSGFKMILTGGYSPDGFAPATPNFIITQQPVEVADDVKFEKGIKIILHEYLRDLPTAKSINYLMAIHLQQKLLEKNADEVLYYSNNHILEFPRSNVFIVTKNEEVITPSENVLHGITRKKVIQIARKEFRAEERAITLEELKNAAEVFLTSTTKRLLPVLEIDGTPVGDRKPGRITKQLSIAFKQMEENYVYKNKQQ